MGKTKWINGKPCSCGCGKTCDKYYKNGVFKGYTHHAPDCTRIKNGPCPAKGHHGKDHPSYLPIGTRRKHEASPGIEYWLIKVAEFGKWPYEHRFIMETVLDRKLEKNEHVHHKDGNSLNNSLDNLVVLGTDKHRKLHGDAIWSNKFECCIICGTTDRYHGGHGMCYSCYGKFDRKRNPEKTKRYNDKQRAKVII